MSDRKSAETSEGNRATKAATMKKGGKGKKKDTLAHLAQLNPVFQNLDFKKKLGTAFNEKQQLEDDTKTTLHNEPFSCCVMSHFVKDEQFLEGLKDELLDQIFYEKNNDLYKFQQTDDLKKISTPHVRAFRKFMYEEVMEWMKEVTGVELSHKVDLTCSRYDYTDTLLCHDDELKGRRFAFILYLVPPWKQSDGGTLDLFNMDEYGQPKDVVKSLVPCWNTFAWFEVSPASYHQVYEVLTQDKTRLSVNGWFHGPDLPRSPRHVELPSPLQPHILVDEEKFYDWINPIYLDFEVQGQIQEKFEKDSEIELQGFLKEEKYLEVIKALQEGGIEWRKQGPANKRHYKSATEDSIPEIVQECLIFLKSEAMFLTLSNLTGLSLHELAARNESDSDSDDDAGSYTEIAPPSGKGKHSKEDQNSSSESETNNEKTKPKKKRRKLNSGGESPNGEDTKLSGKEKEKESENKGKSCNPRCRAEIRQWTHGDYTMAHDTDSEGAEFALDAQLFCCCKGWQQEYGGFTSYIARGEDEELLTVNPAENSLALVYRDKDTLRFVKHINHQIQDMNNGQTFWDFSLSYFE